MRTSIIILLFILGGNLTFGQGEGLFKAKCNTCHTIGKESTGPDLTGVKAKWDAAGETELLYEWVKNSTKLIGSGNSKQATAIKDFSVSSMPDQQVTNEEIDAIFSYIDSYVPPTAGSNPSDTSKVALTDVPEKPNYARNLNAFYGLLIGILVLLFAIIMIAGATRSLISSKIFQEKLAEKHKNNTLLSVILLLGCSILPLLGSAQDATAPMTSVAATSPAVEDVWIHVSNEEIWLMLSLNIVLLGIVIYLKWLFNKFYYMVFPPKVRKKKERLKRASEVLTAAVPIEDESKILLSHEYDGIQELDNRLPPWWLWGFYLTIVFAVVYLFHFHILKTGDTQEEAYNKEMKVAQQEIDAYLKSQAMNVDETNATLLTDESALSSGKAIFTQNCTICHKDGQGDIGPNLTDEYWLYGNDVKEVFKTIKYGTSNGMPDHASKLNPIQTQQVASYILSLKYMPGKEPQGKKIAK